MSVHGGPADWWTEGTDAGRKHIATKGIVQSGLVLNLDAGVSDSYPGSGTTWADLSGNGNNGTLTNGPTFSSANGGSMVFDGTNDYIDCGNIIQGRTTFTAEVWFRTTDTRTGSNGTYHNPSIFGTQHGSGISGDFAVCLKAGNLGFYHELNGSSSYIDTAVNVADNNWKHAAISKSTSGNIIVYINGLSVYSGSGFTSSIRTIDLQYFNWELGRAYWYGEDASMLRYSGSIAGHKLYSRPLTAAEVLQNFSALRGRYGI